MSISLLYQTFSLVGYEYVRTRYAGVVVIYKFIPKNSQACSVVVHSIKHRPEKFRCSFCRSLDIIFRRTRINQFISTGGWK
jgi:hypothetical protein